MRFAPTGLYRFPGAPAHDVCHFRDVRFIALESPPTDLTLLACTWKEGRQVAEEQGVMHASARLHMACAILALRVGCCETRLTRNATFGSDHPPLSKGREGTMSFNSVGTQWTRTRSFRGTRPSMRKERVGRTSGMEPDRYTCTMRRILLNASTPTIAISMKRGGKLMSLMVRA